MHVQLIQPRHVYAPDPVREPLGHVYMPTSILSVMARLLEIGFKAQLVDENITQARYFGDCVGINLVGAPYIEPARQLINRVRVDRRDAAIILGGEVISGFAEQQLERLFGRSVINGNLPGALGAALGLRPRAVPPPETVSLVSAYEEIPDSTMRIYLAQEFGFYVSRGCRYSCSFCGADRSRAGGPSSGPPRRARERYRARECIETDLAYLVERAKRVGVSFLQLYLTNLDLFQSPSELRGFSQTVHFVLQQHPGFELRMRALSNVNSFLNVHQTEPDLISDLAHAGLYRIGFGVDGAAPHVWRAVRKPHGSYSPVEAIRVARECYGLTPETLMVFGHVGVDDARSLEQAEILGRTMLEEYEAIPRPHVAKAIVPGNDGWFDPSNRSTIQYLLGTPVAFQLLDFTALPSRLTHPDAEFRKLVTQHFLNMCQLDRCVTQHILPQEPDAPREELERAREFNTGRYDL